MPAKPKDSTRGWMEVIRPSKPARAEKPKIKKPREGGFYWVKLKPYEDKVPDWEPMQRFHGKWCRVGVIYNFPDTEVEEIGGEIVHPGKKGAE